MPNELLTTTDGHVGIATINRPDKLNALNIELMKQLVAAFEAFDQDDNVHVILLTGNERAFAAGADIGDMAEATAVSQVKGNQFARWERIGKVSKPIVA